MQSSNGMSEHKWLTSTRLQEAHLYISPELNWDSAPLTFSNPPCLCRRRQRPAQHNKTTTSHRRSLWKKHTGQTHPVDMTQSTAQFGILSTLKESHISTVRANLAKKNSDKLSFKNTFCIRTLLANAIKKEVWETASSLHKD
ncbi:uncharacterized protein LOC116448143 [Corvus moneduloides]|uniref:uncharacterized protein LOC116448143 n=1 Tax=Corvus moneduloides TaxID=1196302 RepID=UPI0013637A9C|nr:uncharacterized protein LOC116448143 [Corvus moneduloides]